MKKTDFSKIANAGFQMLKNRGSQELTNRDIREYLYHLPYPKSYMEYFKRTIHAMPEFRDMDYNTMWQNEKVYRSLAKMSQKSRGKGKLKDYIGQWEDYISGKKTQPRRETMFQFAIILHMPPDEFLKALSRYDGTLVNLHSSEEFLMYYFICAQDEEYTLEYYRRMLNRYEEEAERGDDSFDNEVIYDEHQIEKNAYTLLAESFISSEIWKEMTNTERDNRIIKFMYRNKKELTDQISKGENQYSFTYARNLYRMLSYIYVLHGFVNEKEKSEKESFNVLKYQNVHWYSALLKKICGGVVNSYGRRKQEGSIEKMFSHLQMLWTHINEVENRLDTKKPASVSPVTREDVLFLSMLLVVSFMNEWNGKTPIFAKDLPEESNRVLRGDEETGIDCMIKRWQKDLRFLDWVTKFEDHTLEERYDNATEFLNDCLDQFNQFHIHPADPMDRLVLLCLMAEEPWEALLYTFDPDIDKDANPKIDIDMRKEKEGYRYTR